MSKFKIGDKIAYIHHKRFEGMDKTVVGESEEYYVLKDITEVALNYSKEYVECDYELLEIIESPVYKLLRD